MAEAFGPNPGDNATVDESTPPEYATGGLIEQPEGEQPEGEHGDEVPYMLERSGLVPKGDAPHPDMDPPPPEPTLSELAANKLPGSGIVVPPPKAKRQEPVVIDGVFHGMRDVEE